MRQKNEEELKLRKVVELWANDCKDPQIKAKYGRNVEEGLKNTRLRGLLQQAMTVKNNTV